MKLTLICMLVAIASLGLAAQEHVLRSPNGRVEVRIRAAATISYSVYFDRKQVVGESRIALKVRESRAVGVDPKVTNKRERKVDQIVTSVIPEKATAYPGCV
jgi:alpha-glucosidase